MKNLLDIIKISLMTENIISNDDYRMSPCGGDIDIYQLEKVTIGGDSYHNLAVVYICRNKNLVTIKPASAAKLDEIDAIKISFEKYYPDFLVESRMGLPLLDKNGTEIEIGMEVDCPVGSMNLFEFNGTIDMFRNNYVYVMDAEEDVFPFLPHELEIS